MVTAPLKIPNRPSVDRVAAEPANAAAAVYEQQQQKSFIFPLQVSSEALCVRWEKRKQTEPKWQTWQVD